MYKIKAMGIILVALTLVSGQTLGGRAILTGTWNGKEVDYVEGQILVGLNKSQNRSAVYPVLAQAGLTVVSGFNRLNIALVEIESGADLFAKISVLNGSSHIDFAEPNMVIYTNSPNDPYYEGTTPAEYPHHWSYNNTGQDPPSGTMDADIDLERK